MFVHRSREDVVISVECAIPKREAIPLNLSLNTVGNGFVFNQARFELGNFLLFSKVMNNSSLVQLQESLAHESVISLKSELASISIVFGLSNYFIGCSGFVLEVSGILKMSFKFNITSSAIL